MGIGVVSSQRLWGLFFIKKIIKFFYEFSLTKFDFKLTFEGGHLDLAFYRDNWFVSN